MTRINYLRLSGYLIAGVLGAATLFAVHELQERERAGRYLTAAEKLLEQGQNSRGLRFLYGYLKRRPNDVAALRLVAATHERLPSTEETRVNLETIYERLLRLVPEDSDVRRKAIRGAIARSRFTDALQHMQLLEEINRIKIEDDPELQVFSGRCDEAISEYARAVGAYRRAIALDPGLFEAYLRLASLLDHSLGRRQDAVALLDQMVEKNPESAQARFERGKQRIAWRLPNAEEDIRAAVELAPSDLKALVFAAELALEGRRTDEARELLKRALEIDPEEPRANEVLVVLEIQAGRADEAEALLQRAIHRGNDPADAKRKLAELWISQGRIREAENLLAELGVNSDHPELIQYLKCRILMARQQWYGASRALESLRPQLEGQPSLLRDVDRLLSTAYTQLGDSEGQLRTFRQIATADPNAESARVGLADSYAALGRFDEAIREYERMPSQGTDTQVKLAGLRLSRELRKPSRARVWAEVEQSISRAEQSDPRDARVVDLKATLLAARGDREAARRLLESAEKDHPTEIGIWETHLELLESEGDREGVRRLLDSGRERFVGKVEYDLAEVRFHSTPGDARAIDNLDRLRAKASGHSASDRTLLLRGLSEGYRRQGDLPRALAALLDALGPESNDLRGLLEAFELAVSAEDLEQAQRVRDRLFELEDEEGVFWRVADAEHGLRRARRLSAVERKPHLDQVRTILNEISMRRPQWKRLFLIQARLEELRDDPGQAATQYVRALQAGDRDPNTVRRALELLYQLRRYDEADHILTSFREITPISGELQRLAAEISLREEDHVRALALARGVVASDSTDYRALVWLHRMLVLAGRAEESEAPLLRAQELARDESSEPLIELVGFYVDQGRRDEALALFDRSRSALLQRGDLHAIATCLDRLGREEEAGPYYDQALAAKPNDQGLLRALVIRHLRRGRPSDAEPLLERLVSLRYDSTSDADWARNILATLLANSNDPARVARAVEILGLETAGAGLDGGGIALESADRLRSKARVLLATNRRAERIRARSLLEELVRRGDANTEDMFILARVHEIQSNPDRAEELMRKVLSEPSGAPVTADPLVFETERLLRQNQTARAKETLDRLIELEPDSARTTSLRCKYLKATGDLNQARAIVKRFESSHEGNFADFASLYELVEDPEQADQNYRRLVDVKDDASSIIKYLDFLVRSQKPAEAIKLVRERGHRAPREVIVSHLLKTYQRTGATREQQREIDSFVEQAAREEPANRQVQVGLATLRAFQGRAEEAEAICRELLSRDPANGVLQALLAWLLGVREESHSEAIGLINRAIETLGPDPDLLDTRAVIHLASGRVDEAIAELQNVTSQRPSSVYWFHLSRAQWRARDLEGAKQSFRRASEAGLASETIHPMERDAYRELASALGFQS